MKKFNDVLMKEVEHNLNTLYDGTFQTSPKVWKLLEHCVEAAGIKL